MKFSKIKLITLMSKNAILKQCLTALVFMLFSGIVIGQTNKPLQSTEAQTLLNDFPFLAKLLTTENPWEIQPATLAEKIFDRMPKIAQGNDAYPLLFSDQREEHGWPGEKIFDQLAYETEYYSFDREYPSIKLHVGRPLIFGVQHGRIEAVAQGKKLTSQFPYLDSAVIPGFLKKIDNIVDALSSLWCKAFAE